MLVSIEKTVEIRVDNLFYGRPYFYKWSNPIQASSKTTLKFFLKLPLEKKLIVEAGKKDIVIESYNESVKKAWHGQVYEGVLCEYVEPEVFFEPAKGDFANVPIRVLNQSDESRLIKKFMISPDYLMLYEAENGFFTNKVYVNIVGEDEFTLSYGTTTTTKATNPTKVIKEKMKSTQKILTTFSPIKLAREFGF